MRTRGAHAWPSAVALVVCGCGGPTHSDAPSDPLLSTFVFGTVVQQTADQARFDAALGSFDVITLPLFHRFVRPAPGVEDFSLPDAVVDTAPPGSVFFVAGLVHNDLLPAWLEEADLDGPALNAYLEEYVDSVVRHFEETAPGRVVGYEIVLEPLSWPAGAGFWHRIGVDAGGDPDEYIRVALRSARAAAPDAALWIDDFGAEGLGDKSDRYFALVSGLVDEGAPLDGVAFEGHFMIGAEGAFPAPPPVDEIVDNLRRYRDLGLETAISSVDIALPDDAVTDALLAAQADEYADLMRACRLAGCSIFGTWGLGDFDSWIPDFYPGWGSPLLYDAHYSPKPAFDAVAAARHQAL